MVRTVAALLIFFVLAGAASAADSTTVGSGTTEWGEAFTLTVSTQKAAGRTLRCLGFEGAQGGGSGCPLTRPALNEVESQASLDCEHKRLVLYGALDARVARVLVRAIGGQTIEATRFDPVPAVDPQMAYWAASVKDATGVRSVTTVGADGSVLARDRDAVSSSCAEEREFTGRRYRVGLVTDGDGAAWRLDAYRGLIRDDGRLVRTLCFDLTQAPADHSLNGASSGTCGTSLTSEAKALAINAEDVGCGTGVNEILYGIARPKVARIVFRGRSGTTIALPQSSPPRLHAGGRLWLVGIHMPRTGFVIDAQDRYGHTIAKERIKPYKIPGVPGCPTSGGFGTL